MSKHFLEPLSFKEYKQVHESVVADIDHNIAKLKESVFDWKKNKTEIDWKGDAPKIAMSDVGGSVHKAREMPRYAETGGAKSKQSVGRPAGSYGGAYKIDKVTRDTKEHKDALSAKVRAAKAEGFAARKDFKSLMDTAIKKRQIELNNK